jgi:2-dehydro-3-deoxygalactonokinase
MRWAEGFIAVDWGTTNRRAYKIVPDGTMSDEMEDGQGILSVGPEDFPAAVAQLRARLGDLPLLMGGMIGSNRGWVEARYAPAPASLSDLAARLVWPEPGFAAIIPGVSYQAAGHADVMRGEEVQILGAVAAGTIPGDCLVCHPGTHNKWVRVEDGRIASFRTIMTGELFNLLREHSILADLLSSSAGEGDAFEQGVRHGLAHDDLTAELFSVRARVLLGEARAKDAGSYVSGLLIGTDLRTGLRGAPGGRIVVMGKPELTRLFASALQSAGRETLEVDGEEAFLIGARQIAERIR